MKLVFYPLSFIILYFYSITFEPTIIDDAFIQFQYAKNLAENGVWGFYADQTANTATSPLNVALLTLFTLVFRSTVFGSVWLTTSLLFCMLLILLHLSAKLFNERYFGIFLFMAIMANPLLLSCFGMEVLLYAVLWIASVALFIHARWRTLAVSLAMLTLARPDGFLLFVIFFIALLVKVKSLKEHFLFVAIYLLLLLPWHLYSWLNLGSFVPDTLLIKTSQRSWLENISFHNGLAKLYLIRFPMETVLSFLLIPFLFFAGRLKSAGRSVSLITLSYGALHYAAYSVMKVPPYHWYYAHLVLAILVVASLGATFLAVRYTRARLLFLLVPLLPLVILMIKNGMHWKEAPIHTNWGTHYQYRDAGKWIQRNTDSQSTFIMGGEIGTLAYYSDRRLLNTFSDPWVLTRRLNRDIEGKNTLQQQIFNLNYKWRKEAKRYRGSRYIIEHVLHPHEQRTARTIIHSWETSTKWIQHGRLYLRRTRQP